MCYTVPSLLPFIASPYTRQEQLFLASAANWEQVYVVLPLVPPRDIPISSCFLLMFTLVHPCPLSHVFPVNCASTPEVVRAHEHDAPWLCKVSLCVVVWAPPTCWVCMIRMQFRMQFPTQLTLRNCVSTTLHNSAPYFTVRYNLGNVLGRMLCQWYKPHTAGLALALMDWVWQDKASSILPPANQSTVDLHLNDRLCCFFSLNSQLRSFTL